MEKKTRISKLDDLDLLNWIFAQGHLWVEELCRMSNAETLQEMVDYVRQNYKQIKQLEKEKRDGAIL